jgi:hypothetical protein
MDTLWSGLVSFDENDLADKSRFPHIRRGTYKSPGKVKGLTGGRLRLLSEGMHWKAGSILTPGGQLHGSFQLPWAVVIGIDIDDIPFNANFLGGSVLVHLQGGPHVYGEFLGSRKQLQHAIDMSPTNKSVA